jgi:Co/Zn/Cd efflux system component
VVALNLGMGVVEIVAVLIARSQALEADALDFVGDGLITGLAVAAIGWTAHARSRAALLQGVFLAALGLGVLVATVYRVLVLAMPEASTMGVVSLAALAVNVASAALLLPHRDLSVCDESTCLSEPTSAGRIADDLDALAAQLLALVPMGW